MVDGLAGFFAQHGSTTVPGDRVRGRHRSTSPNTRSSVLIMATVSASMWPLAISLMRGQVGEAGRPEVHAERLVGAIGHQVTAELALGRLDRGIGLAGRHAEAFGKQFEMVNQRFHVILHFLAGRRDDLEILQHHVAGVLPQPVHALQDDPARTGASPRCAPGSGRSNRR